MIAYITKGLPGSGKSTWRKLNHPDLAYTNKDELRLTHPNKTEKQIYTLHEELIKVYCSMQEDFVIDNTHLNPDTLNKTIKLVESFGYTAEIVDFTNVHYYDCIHNDMYRVGTSGHVGRDVIIMMAMRAGLYEGLYKGKKQNAWLFDIDGTLSDTSHRTHLLPDWNAFFAAQSKDPMKPATKAIFQALEADGNTMICLSGRPDKQNNTNYRAVTRKWLLDNGLEPHVLLMREGSDKRPDDQVKEGIYRKYVEPYFNVVGVVDDRMSVVRMWDRIGLNVFCVGNPDKNDF